MTKMSADLKDVKAAILNGRSVHAVLGMLDVLIRREDGVSLPTDEKQFIAARKPARTAKVNS